MGFKSIAFLGASLICFQAMACDWGGIQEVRGTRSHHQTVAMCKLIPACLEKYEANEQCKKDWYERRRIGDPKPQKKLVKIDEYSEFSRRMSDMKILKKGD